MCRSKALHFGRSSMYSTSKIHNYYKKIKSLHTVKSSACKPRYIANIDRQSNKKRYAKLILTEPRRKLALSRELVIGKVHQLVSTKKLQTWGTKLFFDIGNTSRLV